jgi:hypothetical protein
MNHHSLPLLHKNKGKRTLDKEERSPQNITEMRWSTDQVKVRGSERISVRDFRPHLRGPGRPMGFSLCSHVFEVAKRMNKLLHLDPDHGPTNTSVMRAHPKASSSKYTTQVTRLSFMQTSPLPQLTQSPVNRRLRKKKQQQQIINSFFIASCSVKCNRPLQS